MSFKNGPIPAPAPVAPAIITTTQPDIQNFESPELAKYAAYRQQIEALYSNMAGLIGALPGSSSERAGSAVSTLVAEQKNFQRILALKEESVTLGLPLDASFSQQFANHLNALASVLGEAARQSNGASSQQLLALQSAIATTAIDEYQMLPDLPQSLDPRNFREFQTGSAIANAANLPSISTVATSLSFEELGLG